MSEVIVIRVKKDGEVKYVRGVSIFDFGAKPLVDSPADAKNYEASRDIAAELENDLEVINYPGKGLLCRSGITVDEKPLVVRVRISYVELEILQEIPKNTS